MEIIKKEYQVTGGPSSCGLKEIKMRLYESKQPIELQKVFIIPGFDYSEFRVEEIQEKRNKGCTILYGRMKHSRSSADEVIMEYRPEEEAGSLRVLGIPNFVAKYFIHS